MVTRIQPAVSDPAAARSLGSLLSRLPDSEPAAPADGSTQLLDLLDGLAARSVTELPEVVLVHELVGPQPALELIRDIALRFPAVGVVLLTRDTSQALYSAAMDAGARGVVGLPAQYEELATRVGAAASWAAGVRRHLTPEGDGITTDAGPATGGTVVAVAGAKGGVGGTLTAVQLALAARASGRETALVDLDLQAGDVASYLDVQFRRSVADLAEIRDISPRVLADAVFPHESGLGLLLAPAEGERGEEVDDRAARQILAAVRDRYDLVVVDCGSQLSAGSAAAIELADHTVLLTTPDVVCVRAAKRTVRLWERLRVRKREETLTVVNRASRSAEIQPSLVARITGTPVAGTAVPANFKELHTALDAGRMQDLDSRGPLRQALWALAGELGLLAGQSGAGATTPGAAGSGPQPAPDGGSGSGDGFGGKLRRLGRGGRRRGPNSAPGPQQAAPETLPQLSSAAGDTGARQQLPPGGPADPGGPNAPDHPGGYHPPPDGPR